MRLQAQELQEQAWLCREADSCLSLPPPCRRA
jgi:hypothetical protein